MRPVGAPTSDAAEHDAYLREVLAAEPQLLLDNGGDLFVRWLERPYEGLVGGTEETTSGRMRLEPLRDRLSLPILVINDSPIKQFAENRHAVGQSTVESYLRITNRSTNGKRVTVFGYGACGRGVAAHFRNAFAEVSVVEIDPVTRLEALLDGFAVPDKAEALRSRRRRDHRDGRPRGRHRRRPAAPPRRRRADERRPLPARDRRAGGPRRGRRRPSTRPTGSRRSGFADGRRLHLLTGGHMVNLAGPRPLGNSIESMDLGFALQARCLEAVATGRAGPDDCVVPVPAAIDAGVASAYVDLQSS